MSLKRQPTKRIPIEGDGFEIMDPRIFSFVRDGKPSSFTRHEFDSLTESQVSKQTTPSGNSLLHVAASSGNVDIINHLVAKDYIRQLLPRTNSQGDTALHASARAGKLTATEALILYAKEFPEKLLRNKNKKGNTALHDAVIGKHHDVAGKLIEADPDVAYYMNGEVKSSLYLAAQNGDNKMFNLLLKAVASNEAYPVKNLEGKPPANAALEKKNLGILELIAKLKPDLLRQKDEKGSIPLHFACSIGYADGVEFLLEKDKNGAFMHNDKGLYPIHVACKKGHSKVVTRLLKEWPDDPTELLTKNGQNVLHVSAEKGREDIVDHVLGAPGTDVLLNEKDEDGNTALHLATKYGRSMAVFSLVRNKKVDSTLVNNDDQTPYAVVEDQIKRFEEEHSIKLRSEDQTRQKSADSEDETAGQKQGSKDQTTEQKPGSEDQTAGQKSGSKDATLKDKKKGMEVVADRLNYYEVMMTSAILHFYTKGPRKGIKDYLRLPTKPLSNEELKTRIENLLVVALLVASVTFAGAIQIPGGGGGGGAISSDDTATGSRKEDVMLKAYIYLDVIALNASIMASLILCWAKITTHLVWLASILIGFAIYLMCLAFVFAAAIAVSHYTITFSVLMFVASLLFVFQTVLCVPLIIPPNGSKFVEKVLSPYIYIGIFMLYFGFRKTIDKFNHHRQ